MKALKIILGILAAVIILPFLIALSVKEEYQVEREIIIQKPKQEVFDYIRYIKNQDYYSVWNLIDPGMKKEYNGTDGEVGFTSYWESEDDNVGKGSQTITKLTEGERMDIRLVLISPFQAEDDAYMNTEALAENETKVKWGLSGTMKYPMNLMLLMGMEDMIGKQLGEGLENLKNVLEKQPTPAIAEPEVSEEQENQ
jgi:hypothetical protein